MFEGKKLPDGETIREREEGNLIGEDCGQPASKVPEALPTVMV